MQGRGPDDIQRLNIPGCSAKSLSSRLSLLPLHIKNLNAQRVNFIAFTPATSFEQSSGGGIAQERVLLYWLLDAAWGIADRPAPLCVLRDYVGTERFRYLVKDFDQSKIDANLLGQFVSKLRLEQSLKTRFEELCDRFHRANAAVTKDDTLLRSRWLGDMRRFLAKVCLQSLKPDLIILDEFQRFKHLLAGDDDAAQLARDLFDYANEQSSIRVLLLSATPYKMLSLHHEAEEEHYGDFVATLKFLEGANVGDPQPLLREYRDSLAGIGGSDGRQRLQAAKAALETRLRAVMARTEREGLVITRHPMLAEQAHPNGTLETKDITGFLGIQQVADVLEQSDLVEYWKSAPYLLNFMEKERYRLKERFLQTNADKSTEVGQLIQTIRDNPAAFLNLDRLRRYKPLAAGNAKLRALLKHTTDTEAWRLLWIPPAMPYHALNGAFARSAEDGFTKRLVFSNWHVVPKTVAAMVSYEAERCMMKASGRSTSNTPDARKKKRGLLQFSAADGEPKGMPVLSLVYPSLTLAEHCDPRALACEKSTLMTAAELLDFATKKVSALLELLGIKPKTSGAVDQRWYWLGPLLLDLTLEAENTEAWWDRWEYPPLDKLWAGSSAEEPGDRWTDHVRHAWEVAQAVMSGSERLGPQPPDLSRILALTGVAGPTVCALRAITRIRVGVVTRSTLEARDAAGQIGRAFISYFNHPEVTEMLRSNRDDEPYWSRVLEYAHGGCIQAMLDEYAHYLRDSLGLTDDDSSDGLSELTRKMIEVLTLRTAATRVDEITAPKFARKVTITPVSMRIRFAMRFGDERNEEEVLSVGDVEPGTRKERVRAAFNSPFWPFVLATTSVGQEGLDFHPYCHAIMHWNLPANPVDLEQREGRIHRYKGHAVRKNIATAFGHQVLRSSHVDVWEAAFDMARDAREAHESDLVPYWLFSGPAKIERHIPMLPLSREVGRLHDLRRSLALYRMVFGQNRQEDLIAFLLNQVPESEHAALVNELRMDLSPQALDTRHCKSSLVSTSTSDS